MKLKLKLTLALLLISLVPLVATSLFCYFSARAALREQVLNQLQSVALIQRNRLEAITIQNQERLALVASRSQLRQSLRQFNFAGSAAAQDAARARLTTILRDAQTATPSFHQLSILSPQGLVVAATDATKVGQNQKSDAAFRGGLSGPAVPFFFRKDDGSLSVRLSGPLRLDDKTIGVIVIESDARAVVALTRDYAGLGKTGETLLVRRDADGGALFLTPLRFDKEAALQKVVPEEKVGSPAMRSLQGGAHLLTETTDYRGVPILAATQYFEPNGWGIVAKIDRDEAFSPINDLRRWLLSIVGLATALILALALLVARSIAQPISDLTRVAAQIGAGDLSPRVAPRHVKGELGALGLAFNEMAHRLGQANADLEGGIAARTAELESANAALLDEVKGRRETQKELDAFFTLSVDMLCIAGNDGYFKRLNPAWEKTLGYTQAELMAQPFLAFVHSDDELATAIVAQKLADGHDTTHFENRYRCKDGSYKWISWAATPFGERDLVVAAARDVTARHQYQEELRRTRKFLDSIIENIPNMIFVKDAAELRFVRFNRAGERLLGYSRNDLIGKNDFDFFPEKEAEDFIAVDRGVLESGQMLDIPVEPIHTANGVVYLHTQKIPLLDENGKPQYLLGISENITARKLAEDALERSTEELRAAKTEAETANRAKSEFLANMSHELRTPLNAIIGFSEILHDQTFGELGPRQAKYVSNVLSSGRHLLQLINDILDLSKIEAGRLTLDVAPFDVNIALNDVTNIVKTLATKKNVALQVEAAPDLPRLIADQPKWKQILYNLLSNAIKFTPDGGRVTVRVTREDDDLRVAISDTGIGIAPADQERAFGEFEQVDSSYARQQQGTGLGLALTKRLVELHGGRIWVESSGVEGEGATFSFVLPLRQLAPASEPESPAPVAANAATASDAPLILIVEDNESAGDLLAHYLGEGGYRVARAFDGEAALRLAHELKPDAITLDIMLPRKDGWGVLTELKSSATEKEIPVVIVSMTDDRQLAFSLGALEFLIKPIDKTLLLETLSKAVAPGDVATGDVATSRPRVLVADDEPQTVEMLVDLLENHGYEVLAADGGQRAIEIASREIPDLLVLDLMMPEVTGFDVVRQLHGNEATRDIPIVIFSAKDITEEDRVRLNSGITGIVAKAGKAELLRELEKVVGRMS